MPRPPQDVTDAELALLRRLWDGGPATIRQLTDDIYPGGGASQYATVQKLLERLEAKHHVTRDRSQSVHVFDATVKRDDLIGRRLKALAEQLCGGAVTPLISTLVRSRPLTDEERRSLRQLIEDLDAKDQRKTRR